eukprot:TRINITY_DN8832_c0_g1_i1.p1 TRINITY_DN8832_c0_g1~~TRINITY_DN8832_c0_g1_i1.p1  ORF type:complete len:270 (+),score=19.76 TRINITY_DN8832_c0_g1_i1:39-848(+)
MTSKSHESNLQSRIKYIDEENIDREFICSICHNFFQDPFRSIVCNHSFCKTCIQEWAAINPTCPIDKQPLKMMTFDRVINNLLQNFQVQCPQCLDWIGKKSDLGTHLFSKHSLTVPTTSHESFECTTNREIRIDLPETPARFPRNTSLTSESDYNTQIITQSPNVMSHSANSIELSTLNSMGYQLTRCDRHRGVAASFRCITCQKDYCVDCRSTRIDVNNRGPYCLICALRIYPQRSPNDLTSSFFGCTVLVILLILFGVGGFYYWTVW